MSSNKGLLSKPWQQFLGLLIAILLIALGDYFLGADGLRKFMNNMSYVLLALMVPLFGYLLWQRREIHKAKLKTAQWKQRIQQIADSTAQPYDIYTFDDFCEFMDDSELERTIEFLEQMPQGQRNLNEAYTKVLAENGGPL